MTYVRICFDTSNAEGDDPPTADPQIAADMVEAVAGALRHGARSGPIHDEHGNTIGGWAASFPNER